jgi:hypothetical protein
MSMRGTVLGSRQEEWWWTSDQVGTSCYATCLFSQFTQDTGHRAMAWQALPGRLEATGAGR